jgi:hypothetical protein
MREHVGILRTALVSSIAAMSILSAAAVRDQANPAFKPVIPKTWDDAAMATLEVPLADPIGSPKHVSAELLQDPRTPRFTRATPFMRPATSRLTIWIG